MATIQIWNLGIFIHLVAERRPQVSLAGTKRITLSTTQGSGAQYSTTIKAFEIIHRACCALL